MNICMSYKTHLNNPLLNNCRGNRVRVDQYNISYCNNKSEQGLKLNSFSARNYRVS